MTLFAASVVGSMPRPDWVRSLVFDDAIDPALCRARLDTAIASVVAMQEHAGLDIVTDGEWRRRSYIGVIAELAHGFTLSAAPDGRPLTTVTGELSPRAPGFIADEARFVRGITSKQVKATLPAPALLGERMWDANASKHAYPTREAFVRACIPILRRELELLCEVGVDIVQIDDPHLCLFVDADVRAQYPDADAAIGFAVDAINELVADLPAQGSPRLCVHLCRRAGARVRGEAAHEGGYSTIVGAINRLRVHQVTMEFSDARAGAMEVLTELRPDLGIELGCVGVTPGVIDDVETIVARVERALAFVDPSRLSLVPDCGFSPGAGARVDLDEVYQKLCNEAAAAHVLRQRQG